METPSPRLSRFRLTRKAELRVPTFTGWVVILLLIVLLAWAAVHSTFPFLAPTHRVRADLLVVEGWIPDYALAEVKAEFEQGHYRMIVLTGGPIEKGQPLLEYGTWPEMARAVMLAKGWPSNQVIAVSARRTPRDRTYESGLALRRWMAETHPDVRAINVYSLGVHARRTRLLFQQALGKQVAVGVIAGKDESYDADRWWTTSHGFRVVLDEALAYFYARFLFHP